MSDIMVAAEGLGKKYRLGAKVEGNRTLRESLVDAVTGPFRGWGRPSGRAFSASAGSRDEIWALREVSFQVSRGDVVGVIGRNGAGKSTLLKILSRITEPTEGHAAVRGRIGSLLEVGTGFHPELTGRENIFLNGAILGMRKAEIARKFDEMVSFAEVERFLDTPVKHYSSGMYLRLAFAVAAHLEPEVLVVDEVLAVGDAQFQKKCLGKMSAVSKEGRTILFVSHNMTAVSSLCGRAIWLDQGRIVAEGATADVVSSYLKAGAPPCHERRWVAETAPGNGNVRFRRVRLVPKNGDGADEISVGTPFDLEFEFWNRREGATLNLSVHLYTGEGLCVLNAASEAVPRAAGPVRMVCSFPSDLLNDGTYTVSVMIVQDTSVVLCDLRDALVFDVRDAAREGNWYGKWPGVVRPKLDWHD